MNGWLLRSPSSTKTALHTTSSNCDQRVGRKNYFATSACSCACICIRCKGVCVRICTHIRMCMRTHTHVHASTFRCLFCGFMFSAARQRIQQLKADIDRLGKNVNSSAGMLLEKTEAELQTLLNRKSQVEADRVTPQTTQACESILRWGYVLLRMYTLYSWVTGYVYIHRYTYIYVTSGRFMPIQIHAYHLVQRPMHTRG